MNSDPNTVHVYTARVEDVSKPRALELLSEAERTRHERFVFEKDRAVHRAAYAMLRSVLGAWLGVPPGEVRFVTGPWGRPELLAPALPLRFNLSHTRGLATLVVTWEWDCGIDVEEVSRRVDVDLLGERVFAASELAALRSLAEPEQRERFFALWTLKEAYIKARGVGLAMPLRDVAFQIDPSEREGSEELTRGDGVSFAPSLASSPYADPGGSWHLARWSVSPVHRIALAIRTPESTPLSVERKRFVLSG